MVDVVRRRGRRRTGDRDPRQGPLGLAAQRYAALGWPVCPGAPIGGSGKGAGDGSRNGGGRNGRACSCDRVGCPSPGAHPQSPTWQMQASTEPEVVAGWWSEQPDATVILVTGRVFDALEVPRDVGSAALTRMRRAGTPIGPVAAVGEAMLFLVVTRGAPDDEDEWWSCHLDCEPENVSKEGTLRWHTRGSYVPAPPSRTGPGSGGTAARWLRAPTDGPLPDALRLLEHLADADGEVRLR